MKFTDYFDFAERVGILPEEQVNKLGLECDSEGRFEISQLEELKDFCTKNQGYHIATLTSDGDDCDVEGAVCITISNSIRRVNREMFYLCDGDPSPEIFLEEVDFY